MRLGDVPASPDQDWVPAFDALVAAIDGLPIMTPDQGRRIWEHFLEHRPERVLDIGTCYGTSAAYMAGALRHLGRGEVVTVDTSQFDAQSPAKEMVTELLRRCDLTDWVRVVRMPHSSYAWWLLEEVQQYRADNDGYDFVYLDGAKNFETDTAAVVMIEQLLRPGGWLLLDDLPWRFAEHPQFEPTTAVANEVSFQLSDAQRTTPHVRAVFDFVVETHPGFTDYRVDGDGQWGWAQKGAGRDRRLLVRHAIDDAEIPVRTLARATARGLRRKLRRALSSGPSPR